MIITVSAAAVTTSRPFGSEASNWKVPIAPIGITKYVVGVIISRNVTAPVVAMGNVTVWSVQFFAVITFVVVCVLMALSVY